MKNAKTPARRQHFSKKAALDLAKREAQARYYALRAQGVTHPSALSLVLEIFSNQILER